MNELSRRSFLTPAAGALAAATVASRAQAQLVYQRSDWNIKEFQKLTAAPARIKQVYDINAVGGGRFLNNIKNSLNGLRFGFAVPPSQMQIVGALHGPANMLNFDDSIWEKYRIGELFQVDDPEKNQPAIRNPFYRSRVGTGPSRASQDPNDEGSPLQDTSIQGLQARGVRFLCCHTATEEQARFLIRRRSLTQQPEDVVKDLLAHVHPGILVVASMVAAIAMLQIEGRYSYITV